MEVTGTSVQELILKVDQKGYFEKVVKSLVGLENHTKVFLDRECGTR